MKSRKLINYIWRKYPKKGQEIWDRCGHQIGVLPSEINRVMVCLDYDVEMCEKAKEIKPDLIITHHPFIFGTRMEVINSDECRKAVTEITENEIKTCVYSFHTCFDNADPGMNDILAEKLQLNNIYTPEKCPTMRIGVLDAPMSIDDFKYYAMNKLNVGYCLLVKGNNKDIKKVGIIGGGAAKDYIFAREEQADIFISGDMAHHTRREIIERNYNYLDIPHEVERVFISQIKKDLNELNPNLEVFTFDHEIEAQISSAKTKF